MALGYLRGSVDTDLLNKHVQLQHTALPRGQARLSDHISGWFICIKHDAVTLPTNPVILGESFYIISPPDSWGLSHTEVTAQ